MSTQVSIERVTPRVLAAVRRSVRVGEISSAWKHALDLVWSFLRANPGLRTDGHNVFLYKHGAGRGEPMEVHFGVEVVRGFEGLGDVRPAATPAGEAAVAVHVGPYDRLGQAHDAIHAWARANGRTFAGYSWEIYGDWSNDPSKLETAVLYLLT